MTTRVVAVQPHAVLSPLLLFLLLAVPVTGVPAPTPSPSTSITLEAPILHVDNQSEKASIFIGILSILLAFGSLVVGIIGIMLMWQRQRNAMYLRNSNTSECSATAVFGE
ncbi:hypothetical protein B0J11DRAFT_579761 [Dendryphion nanum]|uniref:Uncharacterized protein n=1 Tax=Dendryphion nanum TaxID=256645 RepID=A0A9P9DTW2_9PLEO|nr:hypothetical protein B0J11DRAFT_579761 [Dendryphion nanum]